MSDAKRCDRCKNFYIKGDNIQNKNGINFSSIGLYDECFNQVDLSKEKWDHYVDCYFDLCPECALKLLKWMHNEEDLA